MSNKFIPIQALIQHFSIITRNHVCFISMAKLLIQEFPTFYFLTTPTKATSHMIMKTAMYTIFEQRNYFDNFLIMWKGRKKWKKLYKTQVWTINSQKLTFSDAKFFPTKSWIHIQCWKPKLFLRFTLKFHFKSTIWLQTDKIFLQLFII